jgi:hypothetical protein
LVNHLAGAQKKVVGGMVTGKIVLVGLVSLLVVREVKAPEAEGEMILAGINEGDALGITGVASKGQRRVDDTNITSVSVTYEHLGLGITDLIHESIFTLHTSTAFWSTRYWTQGHRRS